MNADLVLCIRLKVLGVCRLSTMHTPNTFNFSASKAFQLLAGVTKDGSDYHEFDRLANSYYKESKAPVSQPVNAKYADRF